MNDDYSENEREAAAILGGGCLTVLLCLILIALFCLVASCSTKREIVTHEVTTIETHDSIYYLHDTLYYEVPLQTAQVTTRDSVSQLENDFAVSVVSLNKDGTLSHKLDTKPQSKPIPYEKPVQTKTQVVYQDKRIEVPMPVEKQLSAWERFKLRSFWALVSLSAVGVCIIFRKPLFSVIRRFI